MKHRTLARAAAWALAATLAGAGCTGTNGGRQNPIINDGDVPGGSGDDGAGGGATDTAGGGSTDTGGSGGGIGQIQAIQKNEAFVTCDEAAAADNFGFSKTSVAAALSDVVVVAPQFDLYTHKTDPAKSLDGYFIMEGAGGPWSGILLAVPRSKAITLAVGDIIDVTGEAVDYFCMTQVKATAVKKTGTVSKMPPATDVAAADLADATTGEQWEAVLVRVADAKVTAGANNFGEWTIDSALPVNDLYDYGYKATVGDVVTVSGVMNYNFSTRKLEPRSDDDVVTGGGGGGPDATTGDGGGGGSSSIYQIQHAAESLQCTKTDGPLTVNPAVTVDGVVASPPFKVSDKLTGYFVSDGVGGPYSGIQVVVPTDLGVTLDIGDDITVTGKWVEYYCATQITAISVDKNGTGAALPPADVVAPEDVATDGALAEAYESVYVQVDGVTVTNPDAGFGQWEVDSALLVDDVFKFAYKPKIGDKIAHLRGFMTFSFDDFKLLPASDADVDLTGVGPGPDAGVTDGADTTSGGGSVAAIQGSSESIGCTTDGFENHGTVELSAVVVTTPKFKVGAKDAWYVADQGGGPYSGVLVMADTKLGASFVPGDLLDATGEWVEYYCMTEVEIEQFSVIGTGAPVPAPEPVFAADLSGASAEQWEGVVVSIEDATVTVAADQYGVFKVADDSGSVDVDDDFKPGYTASVGDTLATLTGPLRWGFGSFKINPRTLSDIVLGSGGGDDTGAGTPDTGSGTPSSSITALQTSAASVTCASPSSSADHGKVTLKGVTVVSPKGYAGSGLDGYQVMTPPNAPNAGLFVVAKTSLGLALSKGDVVDVAGSHKEHYCLTEVFADTVTVISSGAAPSLSPIDTTVAEIAAGKEPLEGSLVKVTGVTAAAADQYGDFAIGSGVLVDDTFYKFTPTAGQTLSSVTGFLSYGFSAWRILPRDASDVKAQ
ncbi:MAG: hypothetical protein AMXMBFR64_18830 [Myxococcales bacterium]